MSPVFLLLVKCEESDRLKERNLKKLCHWFKQIMLKLNNLPLELANNAKIK